MNFALWLYRRLARAFPHEFKVAYGADVLEVGEDAIADIAKREGTLGLVRLLADIAARVPVEYASEMKRDLRYAVRGLLKSPGFALVGIISMGLGIGLTTNVYSSKWATLFREMPGAANAERLVMLQQSADGDLEPVSYYYVEQYRKQKSLFSGVAAFEMNVPFNVNLPGDLRAKPERIFGQLVSPDYFAVLGVPPQRGRVFSAEVDKRGDAAMVVISDRFWRKRLNTSPDAVGQTLHLNGQPATIVGITPEGFRGAVGINAAELFVPITAPAAVAPELANDVLHQHKAKEFLPIMCLAPGVTIESAEAGLDGVMRQLDEQEAEVPVRSDKGRHVMLLSAGTSVPLPRKLKPALIGFFGALMGLVLTLACMNLANMLMARGANRRKELAIRLSVGASRFRLVRQMISEGIVLSLLGGAAGLGIAYVLSLLNAHFTPPSTLPVEYYAALDWHATVFALGVAMLCGVGFSLAPALQATKTDLAPALKEGSALQLRGYRGIGLRNLLIVAQVAASLVLLLLTGFLVVGLGRSTSVEIKFDAHRMYLLSLDPVRDGYTPEKTEALFEKLPERLKRLPQVQDVVMAAQAPFANELDPQQVSAQTAPGAAEAVQATVEQTIGAGYFAAFDEKVRAGREFAEADQRIRDDGTKALPVIVSEKAARGFFGSASAIGKRMRDASQSYEVVGVVPDLKDVDGFTPATLYRPLTSRDFARPPAGGITILVRADARADALQEVENEIALLDPNLNVFHAQTFADYLERSRAALEFSVQSYGAIGLFGLVLAGIGLAGVTAYAVAQRRREIGIRMALGARKRQVLGLVLREGVGLVAAGTVIGFLGAIGLARVVAALANMFADAVKFGTADWRLLLGAPLLLAAVTLLACYVPARKAAEIDPLKALRQE